MSILKLGAFSLCAVVVSSEDPHVLASARSSDLQVIGFEHNCFNLGAWDGKEWHDTMLATLSGDDEVGCVGGSGGEYFAGQEWEADVEWLTFWPFGGEDDGATAIWWQLTTGEAFYYGNAKGEKCTFHFGLGDTIVGDIGIHSNAAGTRVGRLEFDVRRADTGKIDSFACGHERTRHNFPADGYAISGFVGGSGGELDSLGAIIKIPCRVTSREITDMQCVTPVEGGGYRRCVAVWADAGTTDTAHAVCDWCQSSNSGECGAQFTMTEEHSVTTESSMTDDVGGSLSIGAEISIGFLGTGASATTEFSVSYSHSWENSKSQTLTSTNAIASTCSVNMNAHSKTIFDSIMHMGHMKSDIQLTVTTTSTCGGKATESYTGTVLISNVPTTAAITQCTPHDAVCSQELVV